MKIVSFRAEEDDLERWKEEAFRARLTWGEWVRRRLNGPVAPTLASLPSTQLTKVPHTKKAKCEHRLPPGAYCKVCERIKL